MNAYRLKIITHCYANRQTCQFFAFIISQSDWKVNIIYKFIHGNFHFLC